MIPFNQDIDELIFALKNKEYGSYQLRKAYRKSLLFSMWTAVILFTLAVAGPFICNHLTAEKHIRVKPKRVVQIIDLAEPPSIDASRKAVREVAPPPPKLTTKMTAPVVKLDQVVRSEPKWVSDTVGLDNVYSEATLDVQIKYPYGWTYIDQNVKDKLDAVTFWGSPQTYNPPPYIYLEVVDKALFNPRRFKYSKEFDNYIIYYNDPSELSDQYTRVIYIHTETDVDYSLKLIMKGKENFEKFEPVFFGMLESFSFGE